jgi:hypothetical protein
MPHIPPKKYFDSHYASDWVTFDKDRLCRRWLPGSLKPNASRKFDGIAEFIVCQFELNLLNQAIYTFFRDSHDAWRRFSAPCIDTRVFAAQGLENRLPDSILRLAQSPSNYPNAIPRILSWQMLKDYTTFFIEDYMARFMASDQRPRILRSQFMEKLTKDKDCVASVRAGNHWHTKPIIRLLLTPRELCTKHKKPRRERHWIPATQEELNEIKRSANLADAGFIHRGFDTRGRMHERRRGDSDDAKKELALYLGKYDCYRDLTKPEWKEVIAAAAVRNDHNFFKRLGRLLTSRPTRFNDEARYAPKLQRFLVDHWAKRKDGLPELFYLLFPDLVRVCFHFAGSPGSDENGWMEKTCVRTLELKTFERRNRAEVKLTLEEAARGNRLTPGEIARGKLRFRRPDGWFYP